MSRARQLLERLFGGQVMLTFVEVFDLTRRQVHYKVPAIVSRNVIPGEKPYRITWFDEKDDPDEPSGHLSISLETAQKLLSGLVPKEIAEDFWGIYVGVPVLIAVRVRKM